MPEQPITVRYEEMRLTVAKMKQISGAIDTKLDVLRKELNEVPWEGDARTSWMIHQYDWDTAVQEMNMLLQEMARKVNVATENYLTTENEVSRTWRQQGRP